MKKALKIILKTLVVLLILINVFILVSGRFYLYKGISNTYLKGRKMPSATEYQIFENRKINAKSPMAWLKSAKYNTGHLSQESEEHFKEVETHALVIIKNDSLLHEQYWDGFSDTSHTNSFSMSKSYVSALLGCALKDGYIKSIDEPVATYIPEFKNDWRSKITLKHLVSMTSGIAFNEAYGNPFAFPAEGYYGTDLYATSVKYTEQEFEPGAVYRYLSGNSALLGFCITRATGKSLSQYLSERLWSPLGCEHHAYWSLDKKDGQEKAFCCINSNAKDFARMGKLYLHYGNWDGKQLIDSTYVVNSINPTNSKEIDGSKNHSYGYAFYLTEYKGMKVFYMRGILSQYVICVPEKNLVICRLGRKSRPKTSDHCPPEIGYCIEAATQMYGN
jgi:CubicO group peptidase (beta-lactamase class C family)